MNPTENGSSLSPLIHLLDDDAAVRQSLSLLISTVGLRVQTWADPQQFLESFDRQSIGALILDVRMPDMTGLELHRQLLALGENYPVIFMSGESLPHETQAAQNSDAIAFLWKPFRTQQMLTAIEQAIQTQSF